MTKKTLLFICIVSLQFLLPAALLMAGENRVYSKELFIEPPTLISFGFAAGTYKARPDDGLELVDDVETGRLATQTPWNQIQHILVVLQMKHRRLAPFETKPLR